MSSEPQFRRKLSCHSFWEWLGCRAPTDLSPSTTGSVGAPVSDAILRTRLKAEHFDVPLCECAAKLTCIQWTLADYGQNFIARDPRVTCGQFRLAPRSKTGRLADFLARDACVGFGVKSSRLPSQAPDNRVRWGFAPPFQKCHQWTVGISL
jgi:hypothetical protein